MERALQFLVQSQNSDGGWGYRMRGMSYVEPTAAALLALRSSNEPSVSDRARDLLLSLQHADGGWGIAAMDSESGWMTAWAMLALADDARTNDAITRGAAWLLEERGLLVTDPVLRQKVRQAFQIDSTLRGWPWQPGDAAWVHPTSLAILALLQARTVLSPASLELMLNSLQERVSEGVEYLFDRAISNGGWNIGNPWMIDKQIPPTIQDTSIALLSIRAVSSVSKSRVAQAILYLRNALSHVRTAPELAWGIYALRRWGEEAGDSVARLNALQNLDGSWNENPFVSAISVLAQSQSPNL